MAETPDSRRIKGGTGRVAANTARGHLWLSVIATTMVLGGGAGGTAWLIATRPHPSLRSELAPRLPVRGVRVQLQSVTESIAAFGTVQAERYAWISAQVAGTVRERSVDLKPGAWVDAGQTLLQIDDREYHQQLQRARGLVSAERARLAQLEVRDSSLERLIRIAETELEIAGREHERVSELFAQGASNQRELDLKRLAREDARGQLTTLENERALLPKLREEGRAAVALRDAEVALAEINLERTTITAPFSGRLDQVLAEVGEQVVGGQRVAALLDPSCVEIPLQLPVSQRGRVQPGARCSLSLESRPQDSWTGAVSRVSPSAQQATRTFTVFVDVDNRVQEVALVPGMLVLAHIDGLRYEDAVVVPRHCLRDGRVFVSKGDQARSLPVSILASMQDRIVIEGVPPGQTVITTNIDALFDGLAIEIAGVDDLAMTQAAQAETTGAPAQ